MFTRPKVKPRIFNLSDPRIRQAQELSNRTGRPLYIVSNGLNGLDFVQADRLTTDHGEPLGLVHPLPI